MVAKEIIEKCTVARVNVPARAALDISRQGWGEYTKPEYEYEYEYFT